VLNTLLLLFMRTVSRKVQSLLSQPRYRFSGFGTDVIRQLVLTTLTFTKTIWFQEHILPINNSTTLLKIKIKSYPLLSETCAMSIPFVNQVLFPHIMVHTQCKIWKNYLISSLWARISTTVKWTLIKSWGECLE
jgi:hypothetical protein